MGNFTPKARWSKALFMFVLLGAGCGDIEGSGELVEVRYGFSEFERVVGHDEVYIEIMQSEEQGGVDVTIDENLIDFLEVAKIGDTLDINLVPDAPGIELIPTEFSAEVRTDTLEGITLTGGSMAGFSGFGVMSMLDLTASGGSEIWAESGQLLQGPLNVNASGGSSVELGKLPVESAVVSLSSASSCTISVLEGGTVSAYLSGGSRLAYCGTDVGINVEASGGSVVTRLGECDR